jgi:hypothetical protein
VLLIKPIHELSAHDLRSYPIWEFATGHEGEHDETAVTPSAVTEIPAGDDYVVYHAACVVTTAVGKSLSGFMSLTAGELHDPAPVVVGEAGGYFPLDYAPDRKEKALFESVVGSSYSAIFPVSWKLLSCIEGEANPRSGTFGVAS